MITRQKHALRVSQVEAPETMNQSVREPAIEASSYFVWKHGLMRIFGTLLLIILLPAILLLVFLVRCTSSGPGLFKQKRAGKNGKVFFVYKIRSMYNNAEQITGPVWCRPGDSRITPVGKVLRLLYLDELPQLFNVVRGEMCLIGPRPERPEIIEKLLKDIPSYCQRLQVLPGITGLAQINLPSDVDLESVRAKLVLDLEYVQTASLGLDTRILLCTALRVLSVRGGYVPRWLKLDRSVPYGVEQPSTDDVAQVELSPRFELAHQSSVVIPDICERREKVMVPTAESDRDVAAIATNGSSSEENTEALSKKHPR